MSSNRSKGEATFRDFLRVVMRHKKKLFVFFCAVNVAGLAFLLFWPKTYLSEAKLFVRVGRESATLDPTATTTGETLNVQTSRETEINSVLQMIGSRAMAQKVAEVIGAEKISEVPERYRWLEAVKSQIQGVKKSVKHLFVEREESSQSSAVEDATGSLERKIGISSAPFSTVVNVRCRAQTPQLAREITDTLVDVYMKEHLRLNRTPGSLKFFAAQKDLLGSQLESQSTRLSDLKSEKGIVSIAGQLELLETQKSEIEQRQLHVSRELAAARGRQKALENSMASIEKMILSERVDGISNAAADGMRQQLYDLEIKEKELRAKYSENHPAVMHIRKEVAEVRRVLEGENGFRSQSKVTLNPSWQQLHLEMHQGLSQIAALDGTNNSLSEQRETLTAQIHDLNRYAEKVRTLERNINLIEKSYRTYSEKYEQARIDSALEIERISNVNVVQPATLERDPVSPNTKAVAGITLFVALFGGLGLAPVAEYFDTRIKSPSQVEELLNVPVLLTIPRSTRHTIHA